jgi:hypothetical protein
MAAIDPILRTFFLSLVLTTYFPNVIGAMTKPESKRGIRWVALKRWTMRLSLACFAVAFILLVLFWSHAPSFSYVNGKWVAGSREVWNIAFLGVIDLCVLAMLLDRLVLVIRNPRAPRIRRLVRSTALVLAVPVAFAGFYFTHLTS